MKLHNTAIETLIRVFTTYGGHRSENRLKAELARIDFTAYTQQTGRDVLVLTEELQRKTNRNN
tara:strand:+ start:108 stop:296 length:189 start_codon:yes stop_codon:yes gene_type:complete